LQLGNYGTLPYEDLMKGMAWLLEDSPYAANIDRERLAAAGASYGGYMINWIAGHNHNQTYKSVACTAVFFFFFFYLS
jgi:dipeptidyl aminopeptidase/acylaminoacyl peptidase